MEMAEIRREISATPGLDKALRKLARGGFCGVNPPIIGALTRLGVLDPGNGAKKAREIIQQLDQEVRT